MKIAFFPLFQPQHNSRHSLPNDWTVKAQRSHQQNAPPLPPSEPPKPAPPPPPPGPETPVSSNRPLKSIFDIDSPPALPTTSMSTTLSNPVKLELGDIFEDEPETKPKTRDISPSVVKLNKVEDMRGFEKLRDGRSSIKIEHNSRSIKTEPTDLPKSTMMVDIGKLDIANFGGKVIIKMINFCYFLAASQTHLDDGNSNHKKHKKEKKSKKDKKEKRDKDRHYMTNSNGEVVKKHKHKHKDKEKDREAPSSASSAAAAASSSSGGHGGGSNPIPKLKIKMNPPTEAADSSGLAPLKMSISGLGGGPSNAASSKKRHRQHSDSSDSSMGSMGSSSAPALKMSRVLGTSAEQESSFLAERMGSYGIPKNSRKVS